MASKPKLSVRDHLGNIQAYKPSAKACGIISRFGNAQEAYSWRGGGHPDDVPHIEENFLKAKRIIYNYVYELEQRIKELEKK